MEEILDQLQSDMENELDKVSLERLADLNPELLGNIKQTAEETLKTATSANGTNNESGGANSSSTLPSYFIETRSEDEIVRSKAWREWKVEFPAEPNAVTNKLREMVDRERSGWDGAKLYTQREAANWTRVLAGALATASLLQSASDRLVQQQQQSQKSSGAGGVSRATNRMNQRGLYSQFGGNGFGGGAAGGGFSVDRSLFTNRGVLERSDTVIGILYEVGLPFVSSVDGRRFATQQELSSHLDSLFRRNQLEKAMARTEERGWFVAEFLWTLEKKADSSDPSSTQNGGGAMEWDNGAARDGAAADGYDPVTSSVPADETRDRCVVCGINFKMTFDDDDGVYKYSNCREIEMLNDDAADVESEPVLVHVTCWRGLGSPHVLTADQALQETLHHYS
jgi:pre-mRNA cleavage complex 2 protein Pcf11